MNTKLKDIIENVRLWKRVALIAGVYSFIFSILIIANFAQVNRVDPVNTTVINALVERLSQNPDDVELREEIRQLDLLARKAYFTNQWQIRYGGYMLAIGVLVLIIAMQFISIGKKNLPNIDDKEDYKYLVLQKKARFWVSVGGATIVVLALVFAFLTQNQLKDTFTAKVLAVSQSDMQEVAEQSPISESEITSADHLQAEEEVIEEKIQEVEQAKISTEKVIEKPKVDTSQPKEKTNDYATNEEMKKNFPSFRGFGGTGIAYQKNIPTSWNGESGENILWKTQIPLKGYNSPVVWEGKVFLAGASTTKRELYCFDANSGKILWTVNADNIKGTPAKSPSVRDDTGHSAPTVATDGKRVFAIFSNGDMIAADMQGKRVWAKNLGLPQNHYGYSSSLITYKNLVIVQYDDSKTPKILALSSTTGEEVWSTPRKVKVSWASPILVNTGKRDELMLISEPSIASYDPATGMELWSIDGMYGEVGPSLAYANGIVFGVNEYAMIMAVKVGETPELIWEDSDYLSDIPSPVATDKYLFLPTTYGAVACYDAQTGSLLWEHDFDDGFFASPMLVEGRVYLLDKVGVMQIIKADGKFEQIGQAGLGEATVATPAFSNGRIFIRGEKNLYCIGK
ncbi:PQQ-like beta-propeller repeat protein [Perlabentimonas gracilis]|uniref:PQQ-like beta-propeller repeat protein n=1 Tax=Perlabentimonas gracilis TaxID=2715279 RepID=UPI0014074C78|nr:PQQ-like beta-propeller repeat protein [Perlabentimonas gracilis]NHB69529.1 PQQ-binding-like beta-propeller repeat protein [Perlabentimonas gracilis]